MLNYAFQNPPILKAAAGFTDSVLINGQDSSAQSTDNFFVQLRNIIIDTTATDASTNLTALAWGVAQGCAIGNVKINMPTNTTSHIGIDLAGGSTTSVADIEITGGKVGILNSNQQVSL
ncbi:MAG: glycosyl hydrolase family 28-related protein [Janthinobacterium lividum]